jgi:hypothetical protein
MSMIKEFAMKGNVVASLVNNRIIPAPVAKKPSRQIAAGWRESAPAR